MNIPIILSKHPKKKRRNLITSSMKIEELWLVNKIFSLILLRFSLFLLSAMISVMDRGVGEIINAINERGIMNNTIILFYSDNGGPTQGQHATKASNHPLRGQKASPWEGGCRVVACIYSPLIKSLRRVSNEFISVTDLLPTLAAAANFTIDREIDGMNQWKTISEDAPSARHELLYNIENIVGYSAIVHEGWKLLNGTENMNNAKWLGDSGRSNINVSFENYFNEMLASKASKSLPQLISQDVKVLRSESTVECELNKFSVACEPLKEPCLFNIIEDPCEQNNLATSHPLKVDFLLSKLGKHIDLLVPNVRVARDPNCDPGRFNNTWTWWQEADEHKGSNLKWRIPSTVVLCFILFAFSCMLFCKLKSKVNKTKLQV